jgi:hypothetical protein
MSRTPVGYVSGLNIKPGGDEERETTAPVTESPKNMKQWAARHSGVGRVHEKRCEVALT